MSWVAYGAELLLAEPKGKQAPAPAPIPPPESGGGEEGKGGFINNDDDAIYVVYAEIALFLLVAFLNMQLLSIFRVSPSRDQGQPVSLTGGKTRNFFVSLLFLANFFRAFSLGLQLVLMSSISQASLMTWFTYLFRSLPSLIFLSTYSVLIYFWAQVYQAATLVSTPLLRPTFIFVNIAVYCIYAVITVLTLLLHAYEEYRTYSIFLIGVIYLAVSVGFFVYGMKDGGTHVVPAEAALRPAADDGETPKPKGHR
ncbi:unnamed protein product [Vitrella brassicaformis CCMP3155]|uniref:THH1/TOM1/TOM3 domain-containing protein n=1 Tax=Vitrella brassicaformis (strain CCMP3155) TaxID=1169540 RepID=A0A0G4ER92_VITBC|nr:unnamed protein product [Vitrella brassicaformis CCMP3155]|eukprot:CEM00768.1 unnamed protein product [Vitrella brassicaformis CCMP3155]